MTGDDRRGHRDVFRYPGYPAFWAAETVSEFGTYVTTMALQVLIVVTLHGTATDVGLMNAARWAPYLVLGLVVGALVDRWRRRPVLVATDVARGLLLCLIPLCWHLDRLTLPVLIGFVTVFGVMSLLNDAATQSFLPRLVPPSALLAANARLDQSGAVAQTSGPVVAGGLVSWLGAPLAVVVDAVSYLFSAAAVACIRVAEPRAGTGGRPLNLRREIGAGLRWVYRHRMLAPLAVTTHGWFLFNSMLLTVFAPFALLRLGLTPFELGVALSFAGGGGLVGSLLSTRLGLRWGAGRTVIACRAGTAVAWAVIALAPGDGEAAALAVVAAGQFLYGLTIGAENANEMGYRQAVTPDELQGRMNTTMRSINRAVIVAGAPLGGLLADGIGDRVTLWIGVAGFVLVSVALAVSPFRSARHDDADPDDMEREDGGPVTP
ncbi:MFS transporter [Jiangella asiatica]|uniref:MFS transporter n=1 Tax=Jiangella asiatica TaxID=2530372 RepID=A0A4V2Z3P3_9ACTN|nr:MFS transporter [Jiangella asiatica]TDE13498.1 MFS transporter [Jiangella asiatica]